MSGSIIMVGIIFSWINFFFFLIFFKYFLKVIYKVMMYVKYRIEFCCFCGGYDIFNMLMNVIVFDFKIKWWWGVWFIDFF